MNTLKQTFDNFNDIYSKKTYEFSLDEDGLIIETLYDGKLKHGPHIIPEVTDIDIKKWFYEYKEPVYLVGNEKEVRIEWREIILDDEIIEEFALNNRELWKEIKEDGTY